MISTTGNTLWLIITRSHEQYTECESDYKVVDQECEEYSSEGGCECPVDVDIEIVTGTVEMCVHVVCVGEVADVEIL